ncbi:SusF/SusE family outer membrane protein, partial [Bacteroides sp. OttesenSCG-928-J23]|nr:SusF/SusE family outer membrane protein [Bacteroides sp. OttesenSCG-928-J23]
PEPTLAGIGEKGGNILISNGGWYLVVVTTAIEGRDLKYTVELLEPNVYLTGDTSGGWDTFDEARLFTVPATADGDFISPAFVANGELRMCVKLDGIDWWRSEFIILKEKIEYRGTGNDQDRVSVTAGKKAYLNFTAGTGSIK